MKLVYFASVRERIGKSEEDLDLPDHVANVAELVAWLRTRGEGYAAAFEQPRAIKAAIDQTHVRHDMTIEGAREIAFFPPMTGG